jgi:hypothetical protein
LSGLHVEEAIIGIHRIGEHPAELEIRHVLLESLHIAGHRLEARFVVFFPHHRKQLAIVLQRLRDALHATDHLLERFTLLAELLCALVVLPDRRIFGELDHFSQAVALGIEVKDTSAAPPISRRDRRACWPLHLRVLRPWIEIS